ncbi:MAG: carbonic anhydrase family protein [Rubrivivax sp.]|nr:carbonic anhydrase family protein [Rubrivivax sp.]
MSPFRPSPAFVLWLAAAAWLPAAAVAADATPKRPAEAAKAADTVRAKGAAATPPAAPLNALEQLRLRISERLAAGQVKTASGPYDLKVVNRASAVAPRPGTGTSPGAARTAPQASGARRGTDSATAWAYEGNAGPQAWGELKPEFALCGKGQRQSPIDLQGGLAVDLEPVLFHYQASRFAVVDNGHTVQVKVAPGNAIELTGRRYELQHFTFHRPGEGRIDGRQFEMSLHLVHKDAQGRLAVVALLLDPGPPQPVVQQVWNNLPLEKHEETSARVALELPDLLPADRRYYTYMGSSTTPPCSEGVQWVVMRHPVTVSPEQIELFTRLYPMNARPVQAAAGRRIMQSN